MKKSTSKPVKQPVSRPNTAHKLPPAVPVASASPPPATPLSTRVVYGLLLASLLTPFIYSTQTFFGYISERAWYFCATVEAMTAVALFTPSFLRLPLTRLQGSLLIFLAVIGLADGLGIDPIQSLYSGFAHMEGWLLYLHLSAYALVLARIPLSRRQWNAALLLSMLVAVAVVGIGNGMTTGRQLSDHRLIATIGNPSMLSGYLLLNLFLIPYLRTQYLTISRGLRLGLFGVAALVLAIGIYQTGTRSAVLALLLGGGCVAGFVVQHRYKLNGWQTGLLLPGLIGLLAVAFLVARYAPPLQKNPVVWRLTHYSGGNFNTLTPRFVSWKMAANGLADRPILGWGQENFNYGYAQHYDPAILTDGEDGWYDRTHNVLLDWAFSAGILGLLAYLFIWFSLFQRLRAIKTGMPGLQRQMLATLFITYFVYNLLNFDTLLPLQLFFIGLAFVDTADVQSGQPIAPASPRPTWLPAGRVVGLALLIAMAIVSVYQPYRILRALDRQNALADLPQRLQALDTIYKRAGGRQLDIADCLTTLTLSAFQTNQPAAVRQQAYQQTTAVLTEQVEQHPQFTRLMGRLATLYTNGGEADKAVALCQSINRIEGNRRPGAYIQLGSAQLAGGHVPQALAAFDSATRLQPRWEEGRLYQALTYAVTHDTVNCYRTLRSLQVPTLVSRLAFVKHIYKLSGNPHGFVSQLGGLTSDQLILFTPAAFCDWALTAYDLGDTYYMTKAINCYFNRYLCQRYQYEDVKILVEEGTRGTRPDQLLAMTDALTR